MTLRPPVCEYPDCDTCKKAKEVYLVLQGADLEGARAHILKLFSMGIIDRDAVLARLNP